VLDLSSKAAQVVRLRWRPPRRGHLPRWRRRTSLLPETQHRGRNLRPGEIEGQGSMLLFLKNFRKTWRFYSSYLSRKMTINVFVFQCQQFSDFDDHSTIWQSVIRSGCRHWNAEPMVTYVVFVIYVVIDDGIGNWPHLTDPFRPKSYKIKTCTCGKYIFCLKR
jgi:hypothetical protein